MIDGPQLCWGEPRLHDSIHEEMVIVWWWLWHIVRRGMELNPVGRNKFPDQSKPGRFSKKTLLGEFGVEYW